MVNVNDVYVTLDNIKEITYAKNYRGCIGNNYLVIEYFINTPAIYIKVDDEDDFHYHVEIFRTAYNELKGLK